MPTDQPIDDRPFHEQFADAANHAFSRAAAERAANAGNGAGPEATGPAEAASPVATAELELPPLNVGSVEPPLPGSPEELALELAAEDDPWVILERIRTGVTDVEEGGVSENVTRDRGRLLPLFLARVATRKTLEADTLLVVAEPVFKLRRSAMREEVERIRAAGGAGRTRFSYTVVERDEAGRPTLLAEAVLTPDPLCPVKYLVARYAYELGEDGALSVQHAVDPEPCAEILVGGVLHRPLTTPGVEEHSVLLPGGVEDFGSEAALFEEVLRYLSRTFYAADEADQTFLHLVAGYVMMTWLYDCLDVLGYLRFIGLYSTGKTHLLNTAAHACYRPIVSLGTMSVPVLFRSLDVYRGTLAIDESDFSGVDADAVFNILNGGYTSSPGTVMRCEGDQHAIKEFNVFGPKILAGREKFKDEALESRCFRYEMKALPNGRLPEGYPIAYTRRQKAQARALHDKLLAWRFAKFPLTRFDEYARVRDAEGNELHVPRGQQIILAILAAVDVPGLKDRLVRNVQETVAAIEEAWFESREGRVVCAFFELICRGTTGRPDFDRTITTEELDTKLNSGLASERDRVSKEEIGAILGHGGRGHKGLRLESAKSSRTRRSGYRGGEQLRKVAERYRLSVRKQPVLNKQPALAEAPERPALTEGSEPPVPPAAEGA